ncbi:MAG TPA: response regulator, partial [Solirubrobacteraceae bacterium]
MGTAERTFSPEAGEGQLLMLVVDDEQDLRDTLTRSFARQGHEVVAVADGPAALAQAARRDFDVVLLDVDLGSVGPDGYDVCRTLRSRRNYAPIIMLTALDSEADA